MNRSRLYLVAIAVVVAVCAVYATISLFGDDEVSRVVVPPLGTPISTLAQSTGPTPSAAVALPASTERAHSVLFKSTEINRIVAFEEFQANISVYSQNRSHLSGNSRKEAAERLLEVLPIHVRRGEVLPIQAIVLSEDLLKDIEPNKVIRDRRLEQIRQNWTAYEQQATGPVPGQTSAHLAYREEVARIHQDAISSEPDSERRLIMIYERQRMLAERLPGNGVAMIRALGTE